MGEVIESGGPGPQLVVCDIDVDTIPAIRDTLTVLRNRSEFAQRDRAESPG